MFTLVKSNFLINSPGYEIHFKRQPQIELLNLLINYQICNNSQTGMHNNFISSWRVQNAWILRMERGPEENQTH